MRDHSVAAARHCFIEDGGGEIERYHHTTHGRFSVAHLQPRVVPGLRECEGGQTIEDMLQIGYTHATSIAVHRSGAVRRRVGTRRHGVHCR